MRFPPGKPSDRRSGRKRKGPGRAAHRRIPAAGLQFAPRRPMETFQFETGARWRRTKRGNVPARVARIVLGRPRESAATALSALRHRRKTPRRRCGTHPEVFPSEGAARGGPRRDGSESRGKGARGLFCQAGLLPRDLCICLARYSHVVHAARRRQFSPLLRASPRPALSIKLLRASYRLRFACVERQLLFAFSEEIFR